MPRLNYRSMAIGICLLCFGLSIWVVTLKYQTFQYTGKDLSLYGQLMWSLCHGTPRTSLFGGHFLIDHANYIAFLLVPFYFFFQSALTLLYIKLIAFFTGAYLLFLIIEKKIDGKWAALFMLGYILFPSNMAMLFFEFNFENLALPFFFLAFLFLEQKRFFPFIFTCLTLCLIKENMPLVVLMFAVYAFFFHRRETPLLTRFTPHILSAALIIFIIQVFLIQPALTKGLSFNQSNYWEFYKTFGSTPLEILKNIILHPERSYPLLFDQKTFLFLGDLFGPLIIPSLLSPHVLFLSLPLFLQNLLSTAAGQKSIFYYYASTLSVFIFLAAVMSLSRIKKEGRDRVLIIIITSLFIFNLCYIHEWTRRLPLKQENAALYHQAIARIPSDAKVLASLRFLPMLSQRKDLYPLGRTEVSYTRQKERLPETLDHILIHLPIRADQNAAFRKLALSNGWNVDTAIDDIVLLKKDGLDRKPLVDIQRPSSFSPAIAPVLVLDPFIELTSLDIPTQINPTDPAVSITCQWRALKSLLAGGKISFAIYKNEDVLWQRTHPIAYGLPVRKHETALETFTFTLPELSSGDYTVHVWLVKDNTLDWKWSSTLILPLKVR